MMRNIFTLGITGAALVMSFSASAQESLIISEIADPLDDYNGRFIELYNAGNEPVDFSSVTFYLSRQSNGGTTWGDVHLTGSVAAGETYVIGGSAFESIYGFAPDLVTGILIGNGDDAYALFREGDHASGVLYDIYGEIDVDGTGMTWEYTDARAVRVDTILMPNILWTSDEWDIISANIADCDPGTHLGSAGQDTVPPPGDFSLAVMSDTINGIQPLQVAVSVSELTTDHDIISYQFDLVYDNTVIGYTGYSVAGTIADGGTVEINAGVPGKLSVGYMNTAVITGSGPILLLHFNALALDTTEVILSNAFLNNIPVQDLIRGTIIITEAEPPTARITYNDTINRFADTLLITATFSEPMDPANPVMMSLSGAVSLAGAEMTRQSDTVYSYFYQVPGTGGEVTVRLSNGTDLYGNEVVSVPTDGETFTIMEFRLGDVDDDGLILAYDAALTLQYSVGIDPLPDMDPIPWEPWRDSSANVDGTGSITAYDAGLILQYSAGIISGFLAPGKKSVRLADVTVEVVNNEIIFYSEGELLGLNISTVDESGLLGTPEVLAEGFLSAFSTGGLSYRIGLCTAYAPSDGTAIMKIPVRKSGSVTFDMMVNTDGKSAIVDFVTGVADNGNSDIRIFPNPVTDRLRIQGLDGHAVAGIFNIHGKFILRYYLTGQTGEINVSDLPEGAYLLKIETNRNITIRKFLKE